MSENESKGGNELFFLDENGKKQDAAFHEEILAAGEDTVGGFDALLEKLGLAEAFAETFLKESD